MPKCEICGEQRKIDELKGFGDVGLVCRDTCKALRSPWTEESYRKGITDMLKGKVSGLGYTDDQKISFYEGVSTGLLIGQAIYREE